MTGAFGVAREARTTRASWPSSSWELQPSPGPSSWSPWRRPWELQPWPGPCRGRLGGGLGGCSLGRGLRRGRLGGRPWERSLGAGPWWALVAFAAGRRRSGDRGRGGLGARAAREGGACLAGGGLGALGLDGLAGRDAGLGGLDRGCLAGGLGDVARAHDGRATEGGVDLLREAGLAAGRGVRVDGAGLRRAVQGRDRLGQRGGDIDALGLGGGDHDGLGNERLRRRPTGLQDRVPALSLADALQPGRVASALPFPGRSSQGG